MSKICSTIRSVVVVVAWRGVAWVYTSLSSPSHNPVEMMFCFLSILFDVGRSSTCPKPSSAVTERGHQGAVSRSLPWCLLGQPLWSLARSACLLHSRAALTSEQHCWPSLSSTVNVRSVWTSMRFSGENSEKSLLVMASAGWLASPGSEPQPRCSPRSANWEESSINTLQSVNFVDMYLWTTDVLPLLSVPAEPLLRPAPPAIPAKRSPLKSTHGVKPGSSRSENRQFRPSPTHQARTTSLPSAFASTRKISPSACGWSDLQ